MNRQVVVLVILLILYGVGLLGHLWAPTLPWMLLLTPWFLVFAGILALVWSVERSQAGVLAAWLVPVLILTWALEAVGVATGLVFGAYHYTDTLGTPIGGVPPVIGWNWALVVLGVLTLVRQGLPGVPAWGRVFLVAVLCVGFDFLLEPVAIGLGYWAWDGGAVPLQNYLAWGVIAAVAAAYAEAFPRLRVRPLMAWYVLIQTGFFLLLGLSGIKA